MASKRRGASLTSAVEPDNGNLLDEDSKYTKVHQLKRHFLLRFSVALSSAIAVFFYIHRALLAQPQQNKPASKVEALRSNHKTAIASDYTIRDNILHAEINCGLINRPHKMCRVLAEAVWENLLEEGAAIMKNNNKKSPLVAMEVGMHSAKQCLEAAEDGFEVHCVEPSPMNFERVVKGVNDVSSNIRERVHLYNRAASGVSDVLLDFQAAGGTGDHVGKYDMWKMVELEDGDKGGSFEEKKTKTVQVKTIKVDDIIQHNITTKGLDSVFVLKVDTQGFEPSVFMGLQNSIKEHRIHYILFEYWPKGMDLVSKDSVGKKMDRCAVPVSILEALISAGYQLYAMHVTSHPSGPRDGRRASQGKGFRERPLYNLKDNCDWYYGVEENFPSDYYFMGYWSDFLAVSPDAADVIQNPLTATGKALQQLQK